VWHDESQGFCLLPKAACTWEGMKSCEPGAWGRQPLAVCSKPQNSKCSFSCVRFSSLMKCLRGYVRGFLSATDITGPGNGEVAVGIDCGQAGLI
jgi:hypothetical protein